mgnify:CR=1 FL=1
MIRVAINGFGRIGRLAFRLMEENEEFEVVAINDLTDAEQLAYLLKYDTNHRNYRIDEISHDNEYIVVGDRRIRVYAEKEPAQLPWKELDIDVVFECTGLFTTEEKAMAHIEAGAKKVIISAPAKGDIKTIVYNVNHEILTGEEKIISAASCTTNCLAPVVYVLDKTFGINKGFMTTVHAYTNDQASLDIAHKKGINARRGRACAANIVPSSTGRVSVQPSAFEYTLSVVTPAFTNSSLADVTKLVITLYKGQSRQVLHLTQNACTSLNVKSLIFFFIFSIPFLFICYN